MSLDQYPPEGGARRSRSLLARLGWLCVFSLSIFVLSISFGLLPARVFELGCAAGQSLGTDAACFNFMWNAVTTGVFIGVTGPIIGMFLVHREMSLIGETLAHTAFAGVAFGTLLFGAAGWESSLLLTALGAAVVGALIVQVLDDRTTGHGDVPIAIVLTGSFAVGALFLDLGGGFAFVDINSYLFGSISLTDDRSVAYMAVLSLAVVGLVTLAYKQLLYITFDPQAARVAGIAVSRYNALLIGLTAVVVVGAMQILGVILVAAMLVVPVAAASQVATSFRRALYGSILVGELSVLSGLALSWTYGIRPGAAIVVVSLCFYLGAVIVADRGV